MQKQYIYNLAEAYVIDNQLYKENLTADELCESFYGLLKEIREEQPYLYASLDESNKFGQQLIFKNYFDLTFKPETFVEASLEDLNEITGLDFVLSTSWQAIILKTLIGFAFYKFKRPLSKIILQTYNGVMSAINALGKSLANSGRTTQLAYAIIQKNAQKCYQQCDFDPKKDAGPADYMFQHTKAGFLRNVGRLFLSEKDEEKMDCLRECYISTNKEIVKLAAHSYFVCLKNTGDLSRLPLERDFSAYQQILSTSNLSQSCDNVAEYFSKAMDTYDDILDLIYHEEPIEIRKRKNELMSEIYNLHKESSSGSKFIPSQKQVNDNRSQGYSGNQPRPPYQKR